MSSTSSTTAVDPARAAESNTAMILAVTGTFHLIALIFVSLRTYTRAAIVKTTGLDDYMMIMAALCALGGGMVIFIIQAQYGLGKHRDTISKLDYVEYSKVGFFQSIISAIAALAFLKISIALSLLRLSKNPWYSRSLWALIVFVVLYTIMAWLSFFLYCKPLAGYWDKSLKPTTYGITLFVNFALINTAFNIFTDVCFATLPIPIIWVLQMKLRTRVYLIIVLSLGYFAVIMGIIKAVYQIAQPGNKDGTFYQSVQFWGFLQLNLGIIAACAPALKPLVGKALKISSSRRYNSNNLYENRYPTGRTGRTGNGQSTLTSLKINIINYNSDTNRLEPADADDPKPADKSTPCLRIFDADKGTTRWIHESTAIPAYLEDAFPDFPPLQSRDIVDRAILGDIMAGINAAQDDFSYYLRHASPVACKYMGLDAADRSLKAALNAKAQMHKCLLKVQTWASGSLETTGWLTPGVDTPGLADVCLAGWLRYIWLSYEFDVIEAEGMDALRDWWVRFRKLRWWAEVEETEESHPESLRFGKESREV
ncbi:hypothetical protein K4K58_011571 [Colletotrichum sp. SAR11_239]|nr:hypothetical protein K4K58_011571 [Colletotrichum sp. SAR11_239]